VYKKLTLIALVAALIAPVSAIAATVDASLIPDGTYTVTVQKVVDPQHVTIKMETGIESTIGAGKSIVKFTKVKPNDQIECSIAKGTIIAFIDLSGH